MHLYLLTRGIKCDVDKFIEELANKWLPYKVYKDKRTMPDVNHDIQAGDRHIVLAVRPIQLWEIVYPKENRDLVLNTIFKGHDGSMQHKKHQKFVAMLRRIFGKDVKPMGEYDKSKKFIMQTDAIEKVAIGEKEDYDYKDGTEAL